jgi:hypothetical protein
MAQNFAQFQQNGQSIINNPQTSDPSPQRIGQYYDGAGTAVVQNLLGGGYTVDVGATANFTPSGPTIVLPSPPTDLSATAGNAILSIAFTAGNLGTGTLTNYEYSIDGGVTFTPFSSAQTTSPVTISGLTNGTTYTIALKTVTTAGTSTASATTTGTPANVPDAPTLIYGLPDDESAYIYFTDASDAGFVITNYEYSTDSESSWNALLPADILTPVRIPGLTNGAVSSIQLRAINVNGPSLASNTLSVTAQAPSVQSASLYYDPNNSSSYSGSGTTVTNIGSFGAFNGTLSEGVGSQVGTGISRNIFRFDGNDSISFGQYQFGTSFTISAWVYPINKTSINGLIANVGANQAPSGFKLGWNSWNANNRTMYYEGGNGSSGNPQASLADTVVYDTWQYLTYAIDTISNIVVFLRNGVPVDTASGSTNMIVPGIGTNNNAFFIGAFVGGSYGMNAQLGYIKVYNGVKSVGDIKADYDTSKASFGL